MLKEAHLPRTATCFVTGRSIVPYGSGEFLPRRWQPFGDDQREDGELFEIEDRDAIFDASQVFSGERQVTSDGSQETTKGSIP